MRVAPEDRQHESSVWMTPPSPSKRAMIGSFLGLVVSWRHPGPSAWADAAEEPMTACHHQQEADRADDREFRDDSRDDPCEAG